MVSFEDIEEMGEESGREEAGCDWPDLPRLSTYTDAQRMRFYRLLVRFGKARATTLYGLRGRQARVFAAAWSTGYLSNCTLFEESGHLDKNEEEEKAE